PILRADVCGRRQGLGQFRYRSARKISAQARDQSLMLFGLFLTLGVAVLSVALRSFQTSFSQKAGALGILISSYLAIYFITGSITLGIIAALSWLFLPWLEILTRIRTLRLPKEKQLRPKSPPSLETFPTLDDITRE